MLGVEIFDNGNEELACGFVMSGRSLWLRVITIEQLLA